MFSVKCFRAYVLQCSSVAVSSFVLGRQLVFLSFQPFQGLFLDFLISWDTKSYVVWQLAWQLVHLPSGDKVFISMSFLVNGNYAVTWKLHQIFCPWLSDIFPFTSNYFENISQLQKLSRFPRKESKLLINTVLLQFEHLLVPDLRLKLKWRMVLSEI